MKRKKGNIRLADLPTHLQGRFTDDFSPRLYELFGILAAWEQPTEADLQRLWKSVFPDEKSLNLETGEGVIVSKLVREVFWHCVDFFAVF